MKATKAMNNAALRHGWKDQADFVDYLRDTLIPDLKESGSEATAQDFQVALDMIVSASLTNSL